MIDQKLYNRQELAAIAHSMWRGYGSCQRCRMPWSVTEGHSTTFGARGMFPLCVECWTALTPKERLPFYQQLWDSWPNPKGDWNEIETAVLEEK